MSETETIERPKTKAKAADKAVPPAGAFTIEREAFLAAIRKVGQVVESRNTIPILSNLLLVAEGGTLAVRGSGLDILAEMRVPCECSARLGTTVSEAGLKSAVETLRPEGGPIHISLEDEGRRLLLKQGRAVRNLPTLPAEDFPPLAVDQVDAEIVIEAATLLHMLDATSVAMSTEETTRTYLCGVYLHAEGPTLRAAASDTTQIVRFVTDLPLGGAGMPGVILSRKTVGLLRRHLDDHRDSQVKLSVQPKKVLFEFARMAIVAKVIEGTYPPYDRAIPKDNGKILRVHSAELNRCISAAAALAETRGKARHIVFELGREECVARASSIAGAVLDPLDAEFDHDALPIGLNERLAGPLVRIFGEAAQLEVAIDDTGKPIVITSPDKPAITAVLATMSV